MMNRKPETSLQEDLAILGLLSGDAKKALSEEAEDVGAAEGEEKEEKGEKDEKEDEKEEKKEKKEVPAFVQKKDDEAAEMNYAEQLEAAWDVVRNYYKLGEAEDAELKSEDLRTVIDAFAFIVESWDSAGGKPKEKLDDLPEGGKSKGFAAGQEPTPPDGPLANKRESGKYGERGRAASDKKYAPRQQSGPSQTESVNALVSELYSIRDAVQESGPSSEQLEVSESLISGFEAVRDTANEVASRIKTELAESENVGSDDARVTASKFFESIFEDASAILAAIAEGNVEIADAAEDLNTISEDLKKGLAGLQDIA